MVQQVQPTEKLKDAVSAFVKAIATARATATGSTTSPAPAPAPPTEGGKP